MTAPRPRTLLPTSSAVSVEMPATWHETVQIVNAERTGEMTTEAHLPVLLAALELQKVAIKSWTPSCKSSVEMEPLLRVSKLALVEVQKDMVVATSNHGSAVQPVLQLHGSRVGVTVILDLVALHHPGPEEAEVEVEAAAPTTTMVEEAVAIIKADMVRLEVLLHGSRTITNKLQAMVEATMLVDINKLDMEEDMAAVMEDILLLAAMTRVALQLHGRLKLRDTAMLAAHHRPLPEEMLHHHP